MYTIYMYMCLITQQNSSSEMEKKAVLNMEGNSECADCGQPSECPCVSVNVCECV